MHHDSSFYKSAIEKMFFIVNKDLKAVPFKLNPPQIRILKEIDHSSRDIILKARKEGISSLVLAMFAIDFLTVENIRCVVISHEDGATQRLFARAKYFIDSMAKTWPGELPYHLTISSTHEMYNKDKNSYFYIGTAGARAFGRGDDIHNLHVSELSFWREQESVMLGLSNSMTPNGRIIIETTANGYGDYFYDMWIKARSGNSPYRTHFIPWFEDPTNVFPVEKNMELIKEEQDLMNAYHLTKEQISWRRWKINEGKGDWRDPQTWDRFNQENPATADEAFIVSGNPVFSPMMLAYYSSHTKKPSLTGYLRGYNPVSIEPNEKANLKIWRTPHEFHTYAIGVDVSEGKMDEDGKSGGDASCAQVFDKTTYEQVAVWYGRVDPDRLGRELDLLGRYYNDALIGVERNAVGVTPLVTLRDLGYPNLYYREKIGMMADKITSELGWVTDSISKESIIADAINLLRDKRLILYDEDTMNELRTFMRDAEGHAKAAKSSHDDRVMAFLIGLRMLAKATAQSNTNSIEQDDMDAPQGFMMNGVSFSKEGLPVSPDQMSNDLYQGDEF
jgi:hypothetical protein